MNNIDLNNDGAKYRVESFDKLADMLKMHERGLLDGDYQLDNHAHIFELNKTIVVLPGNFDGKNKGFIFFDKSYFDYCVRNEKFPETGDNYPRNLFEQQYEKMKDIDSNMIYFENILNANFGTDYKYNDYESLKILYQNLIEKNLVVSPEVLEAFLVLFGKVIINNNPHVSWDFRKNYGVYNPYLIPFIKNAKTKQKFNLDNILSFAEDKAKFENIVSLVEYTLSNN